MDSNRKTAIVVGARAVFPLIIEMLAGFLFLFIIITNLASGRSSYDTFSDLDADAKLRRINNDPKKVQDWYRFNSRRAY